MWCLDIAVASNLENGAGAVGAAHAQVDKLPSEGGLHLSRRPTAPLDTADLRSADTRWTQAGNPFCCQPDRLALSASHPGPSHVPRLMSHVTALDAISYTWDVRRATAQNRHRVMPIERRLSFRGRHT